jgi:hypothetical protein
MLDPESCEITAAHSAHPAAMPGLATMVVHRAPDPVA